MPQVQLKDLLSQPGSNLQLAGLQGCATTLAISTMAQHAQHPILVIGDSVQQTQQYQRELNFFSQTPTLLFADAETLPYDHFSPNEATLSQRLATLYRLPQLQQGVILIAISTLMQYLLPKAYLTAHTLMLEKNLSLPLEKLRTQLQQGGYHHVAQVMEHGEYATRGGIIDIYPMGSPLPYRIEWLGHEIDTLRSFDPDTQRTIKNFDRVNLLPAHEYPLTEEAIAKFRQAWRDTFAGNPMECPIYQQISEGENPAGIEYYLPFFYVELASFFDYLPKNTAIVMPEGLPQAAEKYWQEIQHRYQQMRHDVTRPLLTPQQLFMPGNTLFQHLKEFNTIKFFSVTGKSSQALCLASEKPAQLLINRRAKRPLQALAEFCDNHRRILFCVESLGRQDSLLTLLKKENIQPKIYSNWQAFLSDDTDLGITIAPLEEGLSLPQENLFIITENQLFEQHAKQRREQKKYALDPQALIRDLTELNIGSPVVHIDHGVGRYLGLQMITSDNVAAEYLSLEYAGGDRIYVPVASLHLINRYTGADAEHAPLQKLGSKQWETIKSKANQRIRDVAAELLEIYSQRQASTGFVFNANEEEFQRFAQEFPFEETPDQARAIGQVIQDMRSPRCMDRLVCGDVGFGKTEVAMQAAFIAAQSGKQVAILVPTTLLANQHLQNFQDRFANWPIKVEGLSRFKTKAEQGKILKQLADGKIDIIIGTHRLLQADIKFHDLGLLIIDEEHRFGVRQKENIRKLRNQVDLLALTATPIPRTLNMSLSGIRDLSIIASPPPNRLAIKTFTHEFSDSLIREAVLRETLRGGQVYFLHNKVANIARMADDLQQLIPQARIQFAHGQMRERELEKIMSDFYHKKFNVLLCTTIIESGIDIPSANTIIINNADHFGLAQLHQLRGRVGRSHHQAYAYLLTRPWKLLTNDGKKRLEAITHTDALGAGFNLASHDLEIRGAGELLGEQQSGQMHAIGFSLYLELLDEAVSALKQGKQPQVFLQRQSGCEVDLHISSLFPETYIHDVSLRLQLYKRLANCKDAESINEFKVELIDRFGLLPQAAQHLIAITQLKLLAQALGIEKIDANATYAYLHFHTQTSVEPKVIIQLIQSKPHTYQLQGSQKLRFKHAMETANDRIMAIETLLKKLQD